MATKKYTVGATAVLDGEREYKQALSEMNEGLRVNYSEMQKVAAQYDKSSDAQKALTARTQALDGAIAAQTEKVDLLRKALDNSIKSYGEGDKRTLNWRTSLNKAEAELAKMNNQMGDYKKQLEAANTGTDTLGSAVRGLADSFGVSLPPMADKAIEKLDGINASGAALVGMIGAIAFKLGDLTVETARVADDLLTLSSTTGLTTDALQEFEYASELLDVSSENMQSSMTRMIRAMGNAQMGTKQQVEAFQKLRVEYQEGNGELRDAQAVFYEIIDALGKMSNETERDAISMQIFGRSARELNPLIEAGSERLAELAGEAHDLGYVMDQDTLESFGRLEDAMQRWDKQQDTLSRNLASGLLPMMTGFLEMVNSIPTPVLTGVAVIGGMVAVMTMLYKTIISISTANKLRAAANLLLSGSNATLSTTNTALAGSSAAVAGSNMALSLSFSQMLPYILAVVVVIGVLVGLFALLSGNSDKARNSMAQMTQEAQNLQGVLASQQYGQINYNNIPRHYRGTKYHPGGLAVVNDSPDGRYGEVLDLPTGTRVYPAGTAPGGDTFVLQVSMDEIGDVQRLMNVIEQLKSQKRRK